MGSLDPHGPPSRAIPPPDWWTVEGLEIPLEVLETGPLPDDVKTLQALVRSLARDNRLLRERLERELKHRYGRRSEKGKQGKDRDDDKGEGKGSDSAQGKSPEPSTTDGASDDGQGDGAASTTAAPAANAESSKSAGHGHRPIPPDLPREEVVYDIPEEEKRCVVCGHPLKEMGCLKSYRYDYIPGRIRVRVLKRPKHVCEDTTCPAPPKVAPLPPEPIPKGRATAGFLAYLLVSKFADHIPVYRFQKILLREGVDLPLSTLLDYCRKASELLKPLWEMARQEVLLSFVIQTDDTYVRVRQPGKSGDLKGHLWAYKGDAAHPYVVFEFTAHWRGEAPQAFLATFHGYIQADAYKGYDALFKDTTDRTEVGCWAHARRKWDEALTSSPQVAAQALEMIAQIYRIEAACKDMAPDERKAVRQEQSAPVLEKIRLWMTEQAPRMLPKSPAGEAIGYATNQWTALNRFLEDGRLSIDNNPVERELRTVAVGRKNWLACGSEIGGETAAIAYTMMGSAAINGANPVTWLTDVLDRISTCPRERLAELLPDRWKAAREAAAVPSAASPPVGQPDASATGRAAGSSDPADWPPESTAPG